MLDFDNTISRWFVSNFRDGSYHTARRSHSANKIAEFWTVTWKDISTKHVHSEKEETKNQSVESEGINEMLKSQALQIEMKIEKRKKNNEERKVQIAIVEESLEKNCEVLKIEVARRT